MRLHTPRMIVCLAFSVAVLWSNSGCRLFERPDLLQPAIQDTLIDPKTAQENYQGIDPQFLDRLQVTIREDLKKSAQPGSSTPINVLALSGGGIYGVFDVGVLCGWSELGTRPTFDVVTGISTGAFIGTFAFLGPQYDHVLRESYLNVTEKQIYRKKAIVSAVLSPSLASSEPLKRKIDAAITPEVLKEIAEAHRQGRRLYVGTTNLDTRKLVIWDMGAIAAAGKPNAIELFRLILLASGSVPAFFPPVYIDIEVNGKKYREMHVDGGTSSSVFLRPFMMNLNKDSTSSRLGSHVYVISSGKLFADPDAVHPNVFDITNKAIAALIYAGGRSDIYAIYNLALHTGADFHLVALPQDVPIHPNSMHIDPKEIKRLYDVGYQMGLKPKAWRTRPPDLEVRGENLPRMGTELSPSGSADADPPIAKQEPVSEKP